MNILVLQGRIIAKFQNELKNDLISVKSPDDIVIKYHESISTFESETAIICKHSLLNCSVKYFKTLYSYFRSFCNNFNHLTVFLQSSCNNTLFKKTLLVLIIA